MEITAEIVISQHEISKNFRNACNLNYVGGNPGFSVQDTMLIANMLVKTMTKFILPGMFLFISTFCYKVLSSWLPNPLNLCCRWFVSGTNPHTKQDDWLYTTGYWDRKYETVDIF